MAITVTMTLTPSGRDPLDGLAKVVTQIECRFTASDGSKSADVYEEVFLASPDPADFTAFADVTAADLLVWVQATKGEGYDAWKASMEADATAKLTGPQHFAGATVTAPAE
jgi:hypothetical protein